MTTGVVADASPTEKSMVTKSLEADPAVPTIVGVVMTGASPSTAVIALVPVTVANVLPAVSLTSPLNSHLGLASVAWSADRLRRILLPPASTSAVEIVASATVKSAASTVSPSIFDPPVPRVN